MNKNAGKKWPIIIALSIVGIIGACIATVKVAINNPVEMSDYGLQNYHEYDANVNDIINAKIAFDKKYKIKFLTAQITEKDTLIQYKISDINKGDAVNNAKFDVVLTRPDTTKQDIILKLASVKNGIYTFESVDLPKQGRWDILAKISIGNDKRYFNLKADTRNPNTFEF